MNERGCSNKALFIKTDKGPGLALGPWLVPPGLREQWMGEMGAGLGRMLQQQIKGPVADLRYFKL